MSENHAKVFPTQLLEEEAELVLCFLKKPVAKTQSDIVHEAEEIGLGKLGWRKLRDVLSALKYHHIVDFASGNKDRPIVILNPEFYEDWKEERLKLALRHAKIEDEMGKEISLSDLYDEKTRRYYLL